MLYIPAETLCKNGLQWIAHTMMMVGKNCVSRTSLYPVTKTTLYYKQMFIFILALLYKEKQQQLMDVL